MAYLRTLLLHTLLLTPLACGDKTNDDDSDTGTTGGPGTTTATTTASSAGDTSSGGAPTTTGDTSTDTSTDTTSTSTGTDPGDTSSGATGVGSSEGGSSTGAPVCELDAAACELAATNGEFEDCGTVDPWDDDAAAWQAAHDCAVKAATEQRAFKVIFWLQGIDSEVGLAYASILGETYGITQFWFDGDPCGGGGCGPVINAGSCEGLVATANCAVEPGNPCLTCADQGPSAQVCGPE